VGLRSGLKVAVTTAALAACVVGCSPAPEPLPAPPAASDPAPVHSEALAPVRTATQADPQVLAQLAELGLEARTLPLDEEREGAAEERGFQGPAPQAIPESPHPLPRENPRALLAGTLAAISRGDAAALARTRRDPLSHPTLTEDDAADARRGFLSTAIRPYWSKVRQALDAGRVEVSVDGDVATVRLQTGGALGSVRLRMRKESDGWYLDQ